MSKKSSVNSTSNTGLTPSQQSAVIAAFQNPFTSILAPSQISITFTVGPKYVIGFKTDSGYTFYKDIQELLIPMQEKAFIKTLNIFVEALNHENFTIRMNARGFLYSKATAFSAYDLNGLSIQPSGSLLLPSKFAKEAKQIYSAEEELYNFSKKALIFERYYHLQHGSAAHNNVLHHRALSSYYFYNSYYIYLQCTVKKYQQLLLWGRIPKDTYVVKRPGQFKEENGPIYLCIKSAVKTQQVGKNSFITTEDIPLDKRALVRPEYLYSPNKYFWRVHDERNEHYTDRYQEVNALKYDKFAPNRFAAVQFHFFDPFYLENIKTTGYAQL